MELVAIIVKLFSQLIAMKLIIRLWLPEMQPAIGELR